MTAPVLRYHEPTSVHFAFDGSIAVSVGDFMYHDTNDVKPFSSQADAGTLLGNQSLAAPIFAGIAGDARTTSDGAVAEFKVITDVVAEYDCASATFEVGDMVGPTENSGGTLLENQKVEKVTDPAIAIGKVLLRYSSATTRVLVRITSRVVAPIPIGAGILAAATVAVGGTAIGNANAVGTGFTNVTGADNTAAVRLPEASAGKVVILKTTTSGKILKVFPAVGDTINAAAANAVYNQANLALRVYVAQNAVAWYTDEETPT